MGDNELGMSAESNTYFSTLERSLHPIAIGPCKYYRKSSSLSPDYCCLCYCICCCAGTRKHDGKWRNCYVKLFPDSTLKLYKGTTTNSDLITTIILENLYKEISFGNDLANVIGRSEVPKTKTKSWDGILAVPDEPHCNSEINWLDFTTKDALYKWLVAICSTVPPKKLRGWRKSRLLMEQQNLRRPENSEVLAIQEHIKIFFPREPAIECTLNADTSQAVDIQ